MSAELLPLFLKLQGRRVLVVGAGPVAASKLELLAPTGARLVVVAPEVHPTIAAAGVELHRRAFEDADVEGAWLVVAAATPEVNAQVSRAAHAQRTLVLAVDDPQVGSAYAGGVVRRGEVVVAVSTSGKAPALAGLLREALDAVIPEQVEDWLRLAVDLRPGWKRDGVPMTRRRPLLLQALLDKYAPAPDAQAANRGDA